MSKYIIDLRPDCKVVQQICVSDDNVGVGARSVELFDALTDDYVKENFKDLLEGEYQRGLNDAWECARKIVCDESCGGMSMKELVEIFNKSSDAYILRDFTAQQAIEMLKAHEKKQGDKIGAGDVVKTYNGITFVVTKATIDGIVVGFEGKGNTCRFALSEVTKTGEHYNINEILGGLSSDN